MWRNLKIIGLCSLLLLLSACKQEKVALGEVAPTLAAYDLQGEAVALEAMGRQAGLSQLLVSKLWRVFS